MAQSTVLQDSGETMTALVTDDAAAAAAVKLSFFGSISFGRVGCPDLTDDRVLQVASLDDLMATKLKVILQRAEAKDYRDIAAMVNSGVSLSKGLASARLLFGPNFQPSEGLKALTYFADGDLPALTDQEKQTLVKAASTVRDLPEVALASHHLDGPAKRLPRGPAAGGDRHA